MTRFVLLFAGLLVAGSTVASEQAMQSLDLTDNWVGYLAIAVFSLAYVLVILEERIHLRKSKPVLLAAGITS